MGVGLCAGACSSAGGNKADVVPTGLAFGDPTTTLTGAQAGGTLRVGAFGITSLDPAVANPGSASSMLLADLLYDGLTGDSVRICADGKIRSQTEDWIHSGDLHVSGTVYAANGAPLGGGSPSFTSVTA